MIKLYLDVIQNEVQGKVATVNSLSDRINLLERKLEVQEGDQVAITAL